jgi:misacylated tRNA(Ala) deacylase
MTEAIFRTDAYLASIEATVIAADERGIILDRTVCYAAGGGQPGDTGTIESSVGILPISTAIFADDTKTAIVHVVAEGVARPPIGDRVTVTIDWPTRFDRMRMHTALHLLSVVLPYPVTGGSIGAEEGRLDFDIPEPTLDRDALQARLDQLVEDNHPVSTEWITDTELDANPSLVKTMSVQPPRGTGRIRLVRIGKPDASIDLQPCGGTHVRSTAEIGRVLISKIEKKGKLNRRVRLVFADNAPSP